MTSERRAARRAALQALFEVHQTRHEPGQALARRIAEEDMGSDRASAFAMSLVRGVLAHREEIDELISATATAWPIDQVAITDRIALQLGIYEACISPDVPMEVAINEAVELAKVFGGENSAGFVNGVLRTIAERRATHAHA